MLWIWFQPLNQSKGRYLPAGGGSSSRPSARWATYPYIAVALGLQARGHEVVIATNDIYREKIKALGIDFRAVRPDFPDLANNVALIRRIMDRRTRSTR